MTWVDDTLRTFGQSMNLDPLNFNERGVICLDIEHTGRLYLEREEEHILIYLTRNVPPYAHGVYAKALSLCHFKESLPYDVHAGKREDHLVFLIRMPATAFSPPNLERALALLKDLHDKTAQEAFT